MKIGITLITDLGGSSNYSFKFFNFLLKKIDGTKRAKVEKGFISMFDKYELVDAK